MRLIRSFILNLGAFCTTALLSFSAVAAGGADYHGEEVKGLPQLDFSTYTAQIFWLIILFALLYVFFSKKTLPEISGTLEHRRGKIEGDLGQAQDFKSEAENVQTSYEDALAAARDKSAATFRAAEEVTKSARDQKLDDFKARSETLTRETDARVEKAKAAALNETQDIAAEIAKMAAEKIVGVSADIKQAKQLVKDLDKKAA